MGGVTRGTKKRFQGLPASGAWGAGAFEDRASVCSRGPGGRKSSVELRGTLVRAPPKLAHVTTQGRPLCHVQPSASGTASTDVLLADSGLLLYEVTTDSFPFLLW